MKQIHKGNSLSIAISVRRPIYNFKFFRPGEMECFNFALAVICLFSLFKLAFYARLFSDVMGMPVSFFFLGLICTLDLVAFYFLSAY